MSIPPVAYYLIPVLLILVSSPACLNLRKQQTNVETDRVETDRVDTGRYEITGTVTRIVDGDTLAVLSQGHETRIRLAGIDAPEKGQAFGQVAKEKLASLVFGKLVVVIPTKIDKYGRQVGKVLLDEQDVNLLMVKSGLAWHFKEYENEQQPEDRKLYDEAEKLARQTKTGLWTESQPIPPWTWRHR